MDQKIREIISGADLVLIGIGEEFDDQRGLREMPGYAEAREQAQKDGKEWMIPFLNRKFAGQKEDHAVKRALENLAGLVEKKNYFLVTTAVNDDVWDAPFKRERIVAPCGGSRKKQCAKGKDCENPPMLLTVEECLALGEGAGEGALGKCAVCGGPMILNNVYSECYDERGYLDQWQKYTLWIQGTLNKRLCILELGVGMQCPSVIRFPFEKIGYFNRKAALIRVNESLYQMAEELKGKGISVPENSVDWLANL